LLWRRGGSRGGTEGGPYLSVRVDDLAETGHGEAARLGVAPAQQAQEQVPVGRQEVVLQAEHLPAQRPQAPALGQGAVAMRLQRGKRALHRALVTDLRREALSLGLFVPEALGWQPTRLWCPYCGRRRLEGQSAAEPESLGLRCPDCGPFVHANGSPPDGFGWGDARGYRARLARVWGWCRQAHLPALAPRRVVCAGCGRRVPLRVGPLAGGAGPAAPRLQLSARCAACGSDFREAHDWLLLCLPEARRFLRDHPRIRFAGVRSVDAQGQAAAVTAYESVTDGARYEVVSAADSLRLLSVHGGPAPRAPDDPLP
jgi:hypothetical protein